VFWKDRPRTFDFSKSKANIYEDSLVFVQSRVYIYIYIYFSRLSFRLTGMDSSTRSVLKAPGLMLQLYTTWFLCERSVHVL
jgi:hypothetical protein